MYLIPIDIIECVHQKNCESNTISYLIDNGIFTKISFYFAIIINLSNRK